MTSTKNDNAFRTITLRAVGRALLLSSLFATAACSPNAGRAQLVTVPGAKVADVERFEQEQHGENHPNAVEHLLDESSADRTLQAIPTAQIKPANELMITDLGVVEDKLRAAPGGAWHFGTLMRKMAGKQNPAVFTLNWLRTWESNQAINGDVAAARGKIRRTVIAPWLKASGGQSLDLAKAPFRLLAIVNRIDLRKPGNAGEGRFVYGLTDSLGNSLPFTVIFEYGIPLSVAGSPERWATRWHALAGQTPGTPAFNQTLQGITDAFSNANADPSKPNGSSLNQLRTNENALNFTWELREFQISAASGMLRQVSVKQSPKQSLNNSAELANFVKANQTAVENGKHIVPNALLGSASSTEVGQWKVPGVSEKARKGLAIATCIGCHQSETNTPFLHVNLRAAGQAATVSEFVQTKEFPARSQDMASLLTSSATGVSPKPTVVPTVKPTVTPTAKPTVAPTAKPTVAPTAKPMVAPTVKPSIKSTPAPKRR